jgi:hypothetical protein
MEHPMKDLSPTEEGEPTIVETVEEEAEKPTEVMQE